MAQEPFEGILKIVFEGYHVNTIPKLEQHHANKFPRVLWDLISPVSKTQCYGDITILTVNTDSHYGDINRTVQWITNGQDATFLQVNGVHTVRQAQGGRKAVKYDAGVHESDFTYEASTKTMQCFVEDLDRYIYSIRVGLPDLRNFLSARLRAYPVYAAEMVKLLTTLYSHDYTSRDVDPDLAKFIFRRIGGIKDLLIKDETLQNFLRDRVPPKTKLEALLRHSDMSDIDMSNALQGLRKNVACSTETTALLAAFMETHLGIHDPHMKAPTGPAAQTSSQISADAGIVHALHSDRRILVATQDFAYGTMHFDRNGAYCPDPRNKAFKFSRGELLVVVTDEGLVDRRRPNSILVQNRLGELGEVADSPLVLSPLHQFVCEHRTYICGISGWITRKLTLCRWDTYRTSFADVG